VVDHAHESTGRMTVEVVIKLGWRGFEGAPFNPLRMHGCSSVMFMRLFNTEVNRRNGTHPVLRSTKKMLPSAVRHGRSNVLVPALKFTFCSWEVRRSVGVVKRGSVACGRCVAVSCVDCCRRADVSIVCGGRLVHQNNVMSVCVCVCVCVCVSEQFEQVYLGRVIDTM
jgi:hypothetical protein